MKVTVLLRNDQDSVRALFDKFKKSHARNQTGKKEILNEIRREILIHSQMEQDIFYPSVLGTSSVEAGELVSRAEKEHASMEDLLQELSGMNGTEKSFDVKMTQLMDDVLAHMEMEEERIFEEARLNLSEYRLEELGLEFEDRKKIAVMIAA